MLNYRIVLYTKDWQDANASVPEVGNGALAKAFVDFSRGTDADFWQGVVSRMRFFTSSMDEPETKLLQIKTDPTLLFVVEPSPGKTIAVAKLIGRQINPSNIKIMLKGMVSLRLTGDGNLYNPENVLIGLHLNDELAPSGSLLSLGLGLETYLDAGKHNYLIFLGLVALWLLNQK